MLRRFFRSWQRLLVVSPFAALLSVLLTGSVALNVALASRLRDATTRRTTASQGLSVGQVVPPLVGEVRVGSAVRPQRYETRGAQGTLLYFSAATCRWSRSNLPTFIELARKARGYRVVAVDLTADLHDAPSHLDEVPAAFVLRNITSETREAVRILGTPETVLLGPDGKVIRTWIGAYVDEQTKKEIASYITREQPVAR